MKNCCVSWRAVKGHLDMLLPEFSIWARVFHSEVQRRNFYHLLNHGLGQGASSVGSVETGGFVVMDKERIKIIAVFPRLG